MTDRTADQVVDRFVVELQHYADLSETERMSVSHNGFGPEYANYLRISYKGETLYLESDAMEPEDATFGRDLNWIVDAVMKAYVLGIEEGKNHGK